MKQYLGRRTLAENKVGSNTMRLLLPAFFKVATGVEFKSSVDIFLIDGKNLFIELVDENVISTIEKE